jgi:hypothetical protein
METIRCYLLALKSLTVHRVKHPMDRVVEDVRKTAEAVVLEREYG